MDVCSNKFMKGAGFYLYFLSFSEIRKSAMIFMQVTWQAPTRKHLDFLLFFLIIYGWLYSPRVVFSNTKSISFSASGLNLKNHLLLRGQGARPFFLYTIKSKIWGNIKETFIPIGRCPMKESSLIKSHIG